MMPDGVELVADAWLPPGGGTWPVLLSVDRLRGRRP